LLKSFAAPSDIRIAAAYPLGARRILMTRQRTTSFALAVFLCHYSLTSCRTGVGTTLVVSGAAASPGLVIDVARLRSGKARKKDDPVVLRLEALSEEAAHLASAPATDPLAAGDGRRKGRGASPEQALKLMIDVRRMRFLQFESGLSANPGWGLLLDLMSAQLAGREVPVKSACVATGVPATTALRLVNGLVEAGFIRRRPDPNDGRRVLVDLTEDGRRRMDAFLRAVAQLIS
jgi:hypothetical protein